MIASPVLHALRAATGPAHDALETQARIEPRLADRRTRGALVADFHRFHAGLEAAAHPLIADLDEGFRVRSRAEGIAHDLRDLGVLTPPMRPMTPPASVGEALGRVYVAEGSMLGGRIIRRRLAAQGIDLTGLAFLDPWGDDTGARWRGFIAAMERACATGAADMDAVVRGGLHGFAFAERALADRCGTETPVD
ncbi:biliverdin-producing heme oxygenase [Brevundimonas sp. PAMC22021]|uniref:biliverdin-producing heme oxygenase n=1 Tax=Brevundimonas sp. PAMC22021 TaxID=2861285 RepID=UPI001C633E7E|nr:biliverdin-producing heme oxygenase [Brevundimonas sp. PAMC22021]QYF86200.1 biliverdin-producing heme oxygenase [Brevundimonas sp. PAMC22021]